MELELELILTKILELELQLNPKTVAGIGIGIGINSIFFGMTKGLHEVRISLFIPVNVNLQHQVRGWLPTDVCTILSHPLRLWQSNIQGPIWLHGCLEAGLGKKSSQEFSSNREAFADDGFKTPIQENDNGESNMPNILKFGTF